MAEDARDILMRIEKTPMDFIESECRAVIEANPKVGVKDPLANGFTHQSLGGGRKTNYFSIDDFTFPVGLIDTDGGNPQSKQQQAQMGQMQEHLAKMQEMMTKMGGEKGSSQKKSSEFTAFMNKGRGAPTYPADLEQMSVTKKMDVSSTKIFDLCNKSTTVYGACILKRKAIGDNSLRGYLRIDFRQLLITDLNWDDGDVIKEDFKFVCRAATVTYCMSTMTTDGSFTGTKLIQLPPQSWNVPNVTPPSNSQ
jgi:type VI protein secretion system component Hcp